VTDSVTRRPAPLPVGFGIELDSWTKQLTPELWFGGSPVRVARLSPAGQRAWRQLEDHSADPGGLPTGTPRVTSKATGALARYFTDTGLAHPVPPADGPVPAVTVIIPARDRAGLLDRCLAALGGGYPVIVVDDASLNPAAVAEVVARHGARLIRRDVNGGAGAARNTGLVEATSDLVAFVDSDCEPPADWIERLAGHFADPLVAVAAPRITGRADRTAAGRYTEANGALDLGARPGRVRPRSAVSFVPTAAVLARREALASVAADECAFDETMRVGEDVDLIWRLHEAGWRIRYDPSATVAHREPASWGELLARRYRYGTSAASLAQRHPGDIVHLALQPWPAVTVAALLARRPVLAAASFGTALATTGNRLRQADVPRAGLTRATVAATRQTWLGLGRYATQFAAPLLIAAIAAPGGSRRPQPPTGAARASGSPAGRAGGAHLVPGLARASRSPAGPARGAHLVPGLARASRSPAGPARGAHLILGGARALHSSSGPAGRWTRRVAIASLLVGPPLVAWAEGARTLDPVRFTLGRIADDVAYGAGVWSGCVARRTLSPLRPIIAWRPLRIDPPATPPATPPPPPATPPPPPATPPARHPRRLALGWRRSTTESFLNEQCLV
jgi:mycofactocin system glycosyltransferase